MGRDPEQDIVKRGDRLVAAGMSRTQPLHPQLRLAVRFGPDRVAVGGCARFTAHGVLVSMLLVGTSATLGDLIVYTGAGAITWLSRNASISAGGVRVRRYCCHSGYSATLFW